MTLLWCKPCCLIALSHRLLSWSLWYRWSRLCKCAWKSCCKHNIVFRFLKFCSGSRNDTFQRICSIKIIFLNNFKWDARQDISIWTTAEPAAGRVCVDVGITESVTSRVHLFCIDNFVSSRTSLKTARHCVVCVVPTLHCCCCTTKCAHLKRRVAWQQSPLFSRFMALQGLNSIQLAYNPHID